jgi:hypothetical protein
MAKKIVNVIKEDAILQIEVSGAYYNRVVDIMARLLEKEPDFKQALINIDTAGKPLSLSEGVIQTFMMLIKSIEDEVSKDLTTHTEKVELEINEDLSEN